MSSNQLKYLVLIAIIAALIALPFVGVSSFALNIVAFILINIVAVSGLVMLYGYADQISLAQGAYFGLGAYIFGTLSVRLDLHPALALAATLVLSVALSSLISLPALRLKGHYLAMGTLAFSELLVWIFIEAEAITGGVDGLGSIKAFFIDPRFNFLFIVAMTALVLLLTRNLATSISGDSMRALGQSEVGARALSIDIERIKHRSHIYAAFTASFGGALYASLVGFIAPNQFGSAASILFLAMAIIGGKYRLVGPVLSVIALTLIQYAPLILNLSEGTLKSFISTAQVDLYALLIIVITILQARRVKQ